MEESLPSAIDALSSLPFLPSYFNDELAYLDTTRRKKGYLSPVQSRTFEAKSNTVAGGARKGRGEICVILHRSAIQVAF